MPIIVLAILMVGLVVTVRSISNNQDIRSKAETAGVYLGLSPKSADGSNTVASFMSDSIGFEADSGRKVAIINTYWDSDYLWGSGIVNFVNTIRSRGSIPMMTWQPSSSGGNINTNNSSFALTTFVRGDHDIMIRSWAQGVKAYKDSLLIRWGHEMNANWYSWGVGKKADGTTPNNNTPQDFIAAWWHVHDIFVQEGATNALWVWCPNVNDGGNKPFTHIYPGDNYVDWICLDGYNFAGIYNTPAWLTFNEVFDANNTYNDITALTQKPLMLGEWASNEAGDGGVKKGVWISDALNSAIPNKSRIKAILWFNYNTDGAQWITRSSEGAKSAYAQGVASPFYLSNWTADNVSPLPTLIATVTPQPTATSSPSDGDTIPPTVTITNPLNGSILQRKSKITFQANAIDNKSVKKVEFYVGTSLLCTDSFVPYSCPWRIPNSRGTYIIKVQVYDAADNFGSNISSVTVN